ncbi:MAG: hypothetical protein ACK5P5_04145, partial [Pseudobdellovibrionaceae bacterium]
VSLVEVLISASLMCFLALAFATMLTNQSRETQSMQQKLNALETERILISSFADRAVCEHLIANPNPITFNTTGISAATPIVIPLSRPIYSFVRSGSPPVLGPVLVEAGTDLSNNLVVRNIELVLESRTGDMFLGHIRINFDESKLIRVFKPIKIAMSFIANISVPTTSVITSCQGATNQTHFEGGRNVGGWVCAIPTASPSFCSSSWTKQVNFSKSYTSTPKVLVTALGESIFTYCTCCYGASDQAFVSVVNVTPTHFTVMSSISPFDQGCSPYQHESTPMDFDWIAIGNAQ